MTSTCSRSPWHIRMWAVALTNSWGKHGKPLMVIHAMRKPEDFFPTTLCMFPFLPIPWKTRDPIARDQRRLVDPRKASIRPRAAGTLLWQQSHALRSRNNLLSFRNSHHLQASMWLSDGHFLSRSETLVLLALLVLKAKPKDFLSCLKEFPLLVTASSDFHPIFSVSSWVMNPFIEIQSV